MKTGRILSEAQKKELRVRGGVKVDAVPRAIEIERQIELIEGGGKVVQETRLFNPDTGTTRSMRSKEDAHDYRYFPEPDLVPVAPPRVAGSTIGGRIVEPGRPAPAVSTEVSMCTGSPASEARNR